MIGILRGEEKQKKKSEEMKVLKKSPKLYKNDAPICPRILMHTKKDKYKSTHTHTHIKNYYNTISQVFNSYKITRHKYSPFKGKKQININYPLKRADIRYTKYIKY